jgi:hypothetical protein
VVAPGEPYYTPFAAGVTIYPTFFGLGGWSLRRSSVRNKLAHLRVRSTRPVSMIAVVGNVIAGLGMLGLFAATLRITRR